SASTRGELVGKLAPGTDRAETLMQHDDGRRRVGSRTDHAEFERGVADRQMAGVGEGSHGKLPVLIVRRHFPVRYGRRMPAIHVFAAAGEKARAWRGHDEGGSGVRTR